MHVKISVCRHELTDDVRITPIAWDILIMCPDLDVKYTYSYMLQWLNNAYSLT